MKRMLLPPVLVLAALLAVSLWNIHHTVSYTHLTLPTTSNV